MSALVGTPGPVLWKPSLMQWLALGVAGIAVMRVFLPGLQIMVQTWRDVEEYSYGYFIPLLAAYLVWQKTPALRARQWQGAWGGLWLIGVALLMALLGQLSAVRLFIEYGFLLALVGFSACVLGWQGTRVLAMPLAVLLFMIPLPQFLLRELSQQLQLLSSWLGVQLVHAMGISVFLDGNVIDLGAYKLQVVDACSGLRYLFPLMALGVIAAYFYRVAMWKRVLVVLSTVPLTIAINSVRIALIAWTVEHWGPAMADGVLHDFEGWLMFMVCLALLVVEMSLLARIGPQPRRLREVFSIEAPEPADRRLPRRAPHWSPSALAAGAVLVACAGASLLLPPREPIKPQRLPFSALPLELPGGWSGRPDRLDREVLDALQLDDHLITNYARPGQPWVNLYSAYYASQSGGASSHSPRTCIPGGGWHMDALQRVERRLPSGASLAVNRAVIQKGEQRQLVYYWFDQRGRQLTDELEVKWFILRDALVRQRSDGALLRLVTPLAPGENVEQAERRLLDFLGVLQPRLAPFLPA